MTCSTTFPFLFLTFHFSHVCAFSSSSSSSTSNVAFSPHLSSIFSFSLLPLTFHIWFDVYNLVASLSLLALRKAPESNGVSCTSWFLISLSLHTHNSSLDYELRANKPKPWPALLLFKPLGPYLRMLLFLIGQHCKSPFQNWSGYLFQCWLIFYF